MKNTFYTIILLFTLLTISCKGEEDELPQTLRLFKITHTSTAVKSISHYYTYTKDGKLNEYSHQGGSYNSEGLITHSYNQKNQLSEVTFLDKYSDGTRQTKTIFTYNDAGLLVNVTTGDGKVGDSFKYDAKGRLTEINDVSFTLEFKYDTRGNVINQKQFINAWDNPRKLNSEIIIEYDDNPNPFYNLGSPFVHDYGQTHLNTHWYILSFSPNNPVKLTENHYYNSGQGETVESRVKEFKYTYGKNKLPIEIMDLDSYGDEVSKLEYTVQ